MQALASQQHQDIPFEHVVELLRPVRSLSHTPLFQVMFAWQNNERTAAELSDLKRLPLSPAPYRVSKFDLTLTLGESGKGIAGGLEYATSLFEASTIERYLGYLRRLLEAMVADDTQSVAQLPMLSVTERRQLLYEWNATDSEYPRDKCIHELFAEQVERSPAATAVVFEETELSYGELNRRANRLAHYLRSLGVKPDERVAICVERSPEMVVALLAVLKAGGAYVPLDPSYPTERLRFLLDDSAPMALLTQRHLFSQIAADGVAFPVVELGDESLWAEQPETNPDPLEVGLTSNHLAYVIYTSGSTGSPKGVMVEHRSLVNLALAQGVAFQMGQGSHVLQFGSFGFDASVSEIFVPLWSRRGRLYAARASGDLLRDLRLEKGITPYHACAVGSE